VRIFTDTSALFALVNRNDTHHNEACDTFVSLRGQALWTHNLVLVETAALIHRCLGGAPVRSLFLDFAPLIDVVFIDEITHRAATAAYLAGLPTGVSLVDRMSFEIMRRMGEETAFAFDQDFPTEGFHTVP